MFRQEINSSSLKFPLEETLSSSATLKAEENQPPDIGR